MRAFVVVEFKVSVLH